MVLTDAFGIIPGYAGIRSEKPFGLRDHRTNPRKR
jgi:hypothetical protein